MNHLPPERRIIHARTYGRTWSASEADPIQRYPQRTGLIRSVLLAIAIGILLAGTVAYNI